MPVTRVRTGSACTVKAPPGLARPGRRHHATLLHYVGANGVDGYRQRMPANAVEIATILLERRSGDHE